MKNETKGFHCSNLHKDAKKTRGLSIKTIFIFIPRTLKNIMADKSNTNTDDIDIDIDADVDADTDTNTNTPDAVDIAHSIRSTALLSASDTMPRVLMHFVELLQAVNGSAMHASLGSVMNPNDANSDEQIDRAVKHWKLNEQRHLEYGVPSVIAKCKDALATGGSAEHELRKAEQIGAYVRHRKAVTAGILGILKERMRAEKEWIRSMCDHPVQTQHTDGDYHSPRYWNVCYYCGQSNPRRTNNAAPLCVYRNGNSW